MKYMIIAGEASGDLHGSRLIDSLKTLDAKAQFVFLGGDLMSREAGSDPVVHIKDMAYMGFSEVIRHLGDIRRNINLAKAALCDCKPDALILIDYPGFNLKIAKFAKKLGIKVYYYISPKVWAWKEHRVKAIKNLIDRMFVIFPFEVGFYRERHAFDVEFVGNPSLAEVDDVLRNLESRNDFLSRNKLRDRPIIAILPGSRLGEIRNNLLVMTKVIERFPQYRGVVAGAPNIDLDFYRRFTDLPVIYDQTLALLANSRAALVTSGTATLEAALVGVPQVACYRSNGLRIAYEIMKRVLKVPFVTLPNLIAGKEVIPEMLVHFCTPDLVFEKLAPLLRDSSDRSEMLDGYQVIRRELSAPGNAPDNVAAKIFSDLSCNSVN